MSGEGYRYRPQAAFEQTTHYERLLEQHPWARELVEPMRRHDYATFQHMQRVAVITRDLPVDGETPLLQDDPASILPETLHEPLQIGGLVHDIGKLTVPPVLLQKESGLSEEEFEMIKNHVMAGVHMLATRGQKEIAFLTIGHHTWQQRPYPFRGEKQQDIPREFRLGQRALALADMVDVLMTDRPYQKAKGAVYAYEDLTKRHHFHPSYVTQAIRARQQLDF